MSRHSANVHQQFRLFLKLSSVKIKLFDLESCLPILKVNLLNVFALEQSGYGMSFPSNKQNHPSNIKLSVRRSEKWHPEPKHTSSLFQTRHDITLNGNPFTFLYLCLICMAMLSHNASQKRLVAYIHVVEKASITWGTFFVQSKRVIIHRRNVAMFVFFWG